MKLGANTLPGQNRGIAISSLSALQRGRHLKSKKRQQVEVINLFLMATAWGLGASLST